MSKKINTVLCTVSSLEDFFGKKISEWTIEDFIGFKRVIYYDTLYSVFSIVWDDRTNKLSIKVPSPKSLAEYTKKTVLFEVDFNQDIGSSMPLLRRNNVEFYSTGYGLEFVTETENEIMSKKINITSITVEGLENYFGKKLADIEVYDIFSNFSKISVGGIAHLITKINFQKHTSTLKIKCDEKEFIFDLTKKNAAICLFH